MHVCLIVAELCVSASVNTCTVERFDRKVEGKADGFDFVVMTVDEVSVSYASGLPNLHIAAVKPSYMIPPHRFTFVLCTTDVANQNRFLVSS